jgi:glucokinase
MIFNQEKLYNTVIGVIFGGQYLQVARVENGSIAESLQKEINNRESGEVIIGEIISSIRSLFNDSVQGIGVGMPSLVDVKKGVVFKPTNVPSWNKVYLKDILVESFYKPVFINNDANCFALGEKYFGVAKDFDNIAGITIGTGMGVGIIINGRLYSGRNAGAGEFCSIPYKEHDYEYYCSSKYFEEKYGVRSDLLFKRAKKGDKIALAIYEIFGVDLGSAVKAIMYALDPDAIVIGGKLAEAYDFFDDSMMKTINTFIYKNTLKGIKILRSMDPDISLYGAAALCFEDYRD